jgi:undecaprenyl-diphosphatase
MIKYLDAIDKKLLLLINGRHSSLADTIMILFTDKFFWLPLYILLLGFLIYKSGKKSWLVFICIALLITAADQFASTLMKPLVARLRPCHDPSINYMLHLAKGCGGLYGFVSSHAANSFALAGFISLLFRKVYITFTLFSYAIVVSYSRIYLAAHYPGDILFGAMAGLIIACIIYKLYIHLFRKLYNTTHESR